MKRIWMLVALLSVMVLSGCGEPKIDGTSEAAFKDSLAKVQEKIPKEKQQQFKDSIGLILMSNLNLSAIMSGKANPDQTAESIRQDLNGKTADQIIAQASAIRAERERKEKEQALAEIQELLAKKDAAEKAKADLSKFTVTKSRFYIDKGEYAFDDRPIIELAVKNGTAYPISRAYFKGTVASPGRSIPWHTDTFNYSISGGLEPGESAEWHLAPNRFGDWGNVKAPADAVFTVELYRLDGPDNKALFNAEGLSQSQQNRLEMLQKKYSTQ